MKNLQDLSDQEVLFVRVQWPESQGIEDQWWFQENGFHLDNGDIMAPADYYIRHKNGEDLTHKYSSLQEANEDFEAKKNEVYNDRGWEGSLLDEVDQDGLEEAFEEVQDLFEAKCGFRTPELITYFN